MHLALDIARFPGGPVRVEDLGLNPCKEAGAKHSYHLAANYITISGSSLNGLSFSTCAQSN